MMTTTETHSAVREPSYKYTIMEFPCIFNAKFVVVDKAYLRVGSSINFYRFLGSKVECEAVCEALNKVHQK